ncbi:phospholipase B1, membrane-associated-like [Erinaceus europaeus]|uniref:Phospholipase B1, membrane-associated-like n=1 Tax=Erinaceus europaeus TaxID=9365 RepID=A0ABM3X6X0_ERIEU|nr:phospholipase B1, membrane-associated-like [Erinaceus europaeus]
MGASPTSISNDITSWRGVSWSIGGDKNLQNQTTLPNILRKFNTQIHGSSTGTWKETAGLNVATEQARSRDLMNQVKDLVQQMKSMPEINLAEDWKLITIFIGINDLCDYCDTGDENAATAYFEDVKKALDVLSSKLSRAFVNVVQLMEVTDLYQNQGKHCAQPITSLFTCPCFRNPPNSSKLEALIKMNKNFQTTIYKLSTLEEFQNREDFTVVVQPFLQKISIPRDKDGTMDSTFFSEDCFHLSARSHDQMAMALWNNMLQPVGEKSSSIDFSSTGDKLICPTAANPYLFTIMNSEATGKLRLMWLFWTIFALVVFFIFTFTVLLTLVLLEREKAKVAVEETSSES